MWVQRVNSVAKPYDQPKETGGGGGDEASWGYVGYKILASNSVKGKIHPLGPLGFDFAQHRQTLRPTVDGIGYSSD